MVCEAKNVVDAPDELVEFEHGRIQLVDLPGITVGRAVFAPGWRWTVDARPRAGTDLCQATHYACVVSGRLHVQMEDGTQLELGPGDAHVVGPGHDAWVVGSEDCITIDFIPRGG